MISYWVIIALRLKALCPFGFCQPNHWEYLGFGECLWLHCWDCELIWRKLRGRWFSSCYWGRKFSSTSAWGGLLPSCSIGVTLSHLLSSTSCSEAFSARGLHIFIWIIIEKRWISPARIARLLGNSSWPWVTRPEAVFYRTESPHSACLWSLSWGNLFGVSAPTAIFTILS